MYYALSNPFSSLRLCVSARKQFFFALGLNGVAIPNAVYDLVFHGGYGIIDLRDSRTGT